MARRVGQIAERGRSTWLVRVYNGRDPETKKRKYLNQTVHGGLRDAQAPLNRMLGERDRAALWASGDRRDSQHMRAQGYTSTMRPLSLPEPNARRYGGRRRVQDTGWTHVARGRDSSGPWQQVNVNASATTSTIRSRLPLLASAVFSPELGACSS